MKSYCAILAALLFPLAGMAQSTSVTATITDSDGTAWANGKVTATFVPGPVNAYKWTGGAIPPTVSGSMDGTGTFTLTLPDNTLITPYGSSWSFSVCPNASSPCVTRQLQVAGPSMNLSSQLSAVATAPRFAATSSVQSFGYTDGEVQPLPQPGGWYFNVTSVKSRQWNGTQWVDFSGSGGSPSAPINSIQIAGSSGFSSDANFTINPSTHTFTANGNTLLNAMSSVPRQIYDPMDTKFDGGLAAAIAGTSGYTPSQVLQSAMDYAACQVATGATTAQSTSIPLPQVGNISITGIKLWGFQAFGADFGTVGPQLQHVDNSQYMVAQHQAGDTLVCNGTTYTPATGNTYIHNFIISGMGSPNTDTDVGVFSNIGYSVVANIAGGSQGFGGPAVYTTGEEAYGKNLGLHEGNLQGCGTYTRGVRPVSDFLSGGGFGSGYCGTVMGGGTDYIGIDGVYATDGSVDFTPGHNAAPCYPKCGALVAGEGWYDHAFLQLSTVGAITLGGNAVQTSLNHIRVDYTSREAVSVYGQTHAYDVATTSPCTDATLATAFGANTATGCAAVAQTYQQGGDSVWRDGRSTVSGVFPPSYPQAWYIDGTNFDSAPPNAYDAANYRYGDTNASNTTPNGWFLAPSSGSSGSPVILLSAGPPESTSVTTPNVNGLGNVFLSAGQTVTGLLGGIPGQQVVISGSGTIQSGATTTGGVYPFANPSGANITISCTIKYNCNTGLLYQFIGAAWVYIGGTH